MKACNDLHDDVELAYQKEKVQQENVVKFAAAELTAVPVEDISAEVKAPAEENDEDDESDAKSQVDAENKEAKLKAARERHVQGALNDAVRFVLRPNEKRLYTTLFQESLFVQNRHSLTRDDGDFTWRHGWLYDCCADQEPSIADKSKNHIRGVSPQPDGPMAKLFFESALGIAKDNDVLIAPNARS